MKTYANGRFKAANYRKLGVEYTRKVETYLVVPTRGFMS
jgi:hypothetical protein